MTSLFIHRLKKNLHHTLRCVHRTPAPPGEKLDDCMRWVRVGWGWGGVWGTIAVYRSIDKRHKKVVLIVWIIITPESSSVKKACNIIQLHSNEQEVIWKPAISIMVVTRWCSWSRASFETHRFSFSRLLINCTSSEGTPGLTFYPPPFIPTNILVLQRQHIYRLFL